ncbi:hypothetical protein SAMN04489764_3771 [Thermostaphylospora chromogena]|uniref:Uncharacterized protein n=2 Tax=Thermostaphylospora chromogena TaxID=35622 RepID=A0A1H1GRP7_9ACTN|nr:hypothetical protein SAMN04489764_3771 [Thermostaphylospora chromogena]
MDPGEGKRMQRTAPILSALLVLALAAAPAAHAHRAGDGGSAVAAGPAAAHKPKLRECYDARCTFTVRKPVTFPIAKRFGFSKLTVRRVGGGSVSVTGRAPNGYAQVTVGRGGVGHLNGISIRVLSISDTKARVRLAPTG